MCGICGFNSEDGNLLKKMCDLIKHRGPDDEGYYTDSFISIGMRRLSIIDLKTGQQPQHNENEDIWIVYNGEVYNFIELRDKLERAGHIFYTDSDTEVVIHAYEEWGFEAFKIIRGEFAFCLYEIKEKLIILVRDPLGVKPLYYYYDGEKFIFGSEIKCILLHGVNKQINEQALNYYISLNYVPTHQTLFKSINKVPPSSYLIFNLNSKSIEIKKYYNLKFEINKNKSEDILAKELRKLLEDSVKIRTIGEVPIGAFLSGGIDSSIVVALMSKCFKNSVKTYSIGFEKGSPVNEVQYAKLVSEHFNTDHTELTIKSTCYEILPQLIWYFDDLIADAAIIPVYFMAKLAKDKVTVVLTGDGADEVFAGYAENYGLNKKNYYKYIPKKIIDNTMKFYNYIPYHKMKIFLSVLNSSTTSENLFFRPFLMVKDEEKSSVLPFKTEKIQTLLKKNLIRDLDQINQYINYELQYQLPNFYNMKSDKMSMAASLELRVPMLDREIVNWSTKIPSEMKLKGNIEKYILRLAMKDLLPTPILKRKKQGFGTPVNLWLNRGMKEVSSDLLEKLEKRKSIINSKYVKIINKNRFDFLYQNRVWNLMMLEIWYETFIEKNEIKQIKF